MIRAFAPFQICFMQQTIRRRAGALQIEAAVRRRSTSLMGDNSSDPQLILIRALQSFVQNFSSFDRRTALLDFEGNSKAPPQIEKRAIFAQILSCTMAQGHGRALNPPSEVVRPRRGSPRPGTCDRPGSATQSRRRLDTAAALVVVT